MIHISQVLPLINKQLNTMQPKEAVQLKTFKKDRGFLLYCIALDEFMIVENGFNNTTFNGDANQIKKQAKKCLKREFPRSNKVWVEYYEGVDSPFEIGSQHTKQLSLL